jgi:hypothetical protein
VRFVHSGLATPAAARRPPGPGPVPIAAWLAVARALAADTPVTCRVAAPPDLAAEDWARRLRERTLSRAAEPAPGRP